MRFNRLLYFSMDPACCEAFLRYVKDFRLDSKYSFRLLENEWTEEGYRHPSDLLFLLDKTEDHGEEDGRLFVIIDYTSLCEPRSDEPYDSFERTQDLIHRAILKYPDVFFLFDESHHNTKFDYLDFLFLGESGRFRKEIFHAYHAFDIKQNDPFYAIRDGRDNLFDGSNLRYAVKQVLYGKLNVNTHNFSEIQDKRFNNLALCVEEEHSQCRYNGYGLFIKGFRTLPVSSSRELKRLNGLGLKPQLVLRDFDLQFADVEDLPEEVVVEEEKLTYRTIDEIRGAKYCDDSPVNSKLKDKWVVRDIKQNSYWSGILGDSPPVRFITKGHRNDAFVLGSVEQDCFLFYVKPQPAGQENDVADFKTVEKKKAVLPGINKPVTGLYDPFSKLLENVKLPEPESCPSEKRQNEAYFDTTRTNHDHGLPLDLYDLASGMIDRAERCFRLRRFVRAAVISTEAMEVMNGFHQALMLRAYHIKAVSGNAIAMNVIGSSEQDLENDTDKRIEIYTKFVKRMLFRPNKAEHDRSDLEPNVLNQIFSDCRSFCREKEQFKSEEAFIAAMARLNDGLTLSEIWKRVKRLYNNRKNR